MKATGVIRRFDDLGRLVVPKELRRKLDMENAMVEFYVEEDKVILKKYVPDGGCKVCGEVGETVKIGDVTLCHKCIQNFSNAQYMNTAGGDN
jgi:transcriptional pleiotropic regulator of transition state genes